MRKSETMTKRTDLIKGKCIVEAAWDEDDYEVKFVFEDGTQLEIGVMGQHCDDAWLVFRVNNETV